jgi:cytochrome b pre-mRNA-processing protein 3
MLNALRRTSEKARLVRALNQALTAQSRLPVFYREYGVADTIDGRFDMLCLHAWLVLSRMKSAGEQELAQLLSDAIFIGFDEALRDLGAGDMGMGPRMKKLGNAFNGRLNAYEAAADDETLADAILRNIYRGDAAHEREAVAMARYARAARLKLDTCDPATGALAFGAPTTTFDRP